MPTPLGDAYNRLFNERFKAHVLARQKLAEKGICTWNDLYEGTKLKSLGVSTNTLSSVLKSMEKDGTLIKVKAPFPWRAKYQLVKNNQYVDLIIKLTKLRSDRGLKQFIYEKENDVEGLSKLGENVVKEWELMCKLAFIKLLRDGFEGLNEANPDLAALIGFFLVDYLFNTTANIHGKARKEAERLLLNDVEKIMLEHDEAELTKVISALAT